VIKKETQRLEKWQMENVVNVGGGEVGIVVWFSVLLFFWGWWTHPCVGLSADFVTQVSSIINSKPGTCRFVVADLLFSPWLGVVGGGVAYPRRGAPFRRRTQHLSLTTRGTGRAGGAISPHRARRYPGGGACRSKNRK